MALPFLSNSGKRRDQAVVVDLGTRVTKAASIQRKGEAYVLTGFAMVDAPVYDRGISPDILAEHLKAVMQQLGVRTKHIVVVLGVGDSILRTAELPMVGVNDMRMMLRLNSKNYLQQDFPDYLFDCHILLGGGPLDASKAGADGGVKTQVKVKALVGGAKRQLTEDVKLAGKNAGFTVDVVTSGLIGPANAFEMAMPDVFSKEVVALVDFGYKNSTISILMMGELMLTRVVGFGAAKLTTGIAESLGISNAEAEGIKVGMPQEVESTIQPLLTPLGRELRASIDFFEHQQDKTVSQVFFSGGSARSEYIINALQSELMVPCKAWNPTVFMTPGLPPAQLGELEQVAPQLVVAIGGAMAAF
ncbi:MAG TPA: pilus assembly protein PilM [Verrucomicrobiae bacterium]